MACDDEQLTEEIIMQGVQAGFDAVARVHEIRASSPYHYDVVQQAVVEGGYRCLREGSFAPAGRCELFDPPVSKQMDIVYKVMAEVIGGGSYEEARDCIRKALERAYQFGYARGHRVGVSDILSWHERTGELPTAVEADNAGLALLDLMCDKPDWIEEHKQLKRNND